MRGDITLKLLSGIAEGGRTLEDLFVIFTSPYGSSFGKIDRRLQQSRTLRRRREDTLRKEQRSFENTLYRLRRDGLVDRSGKPQITALGRRTLRDLKGLKRATLPSPTYHPTAAATLKIIIFDIPEQERRKRNWLNAALQNLKFRRLQKSVFIGKQNIPEQFLADLERLRLLPYVEIFAVSKTGSLRQVSYS
jgi:DNA-binding transcriptional regulator PaaX